MRRGWYQLARNVDVASGCVGFGAVSGIESDCDCGSGYGFGPGSDAVCVLPTAAHACACGYTE